MVRIRRIDEDTADKPARTGCIERVEPCIGYARIRGVGILRDEDASGRRSRPQCGCIGSSPCQRCHVPAGPTRPTVVRRRTSARRQVRCAGWSDLDEVTTSRICARSRKLRAVGFEERLIAGPILRSPDAQRTLEDGPCGGRIGDDGRIKQRGFPAGHDRTTGDDPLHWVAILEVHIVEIRRERVQPERRVAYVKARLTAIAVNDLWPDHSRASGLKCSVILRAALKMLRIISSN